MIRNFVRRITSLPSIAPPFVPTRETINFLFPDNNEPKQNQ